MLKHSPALPEYVVMKCLAQLRVMGFCNLGVMGAVRFGSNDHTLEANTGNNFLKFTLFLGNHVKRVTFSFSFTKSRGKRNYLSLNTGRKNAFGLTTC